MSRGLPDTAVECNQLEGEEVTCSEVRSHMLAMLRVVSSEDLSQPDSDLDASGEMLASMNSAVKSVTWEQVKLTVAKDKDMLELVAWIEGGCLGAKGDLTEAIQEYWGVKDELHVSEGVPLYGERTIVPRGLRQAVLTTLHSAHQGVTGMMLRAGTSVYTCPGCSSRGQTNTDNPAEYGYIRNRIVPLGMKRISI